MSKEKAKSSKIKVLAIGVAAIIISFSFVALYFGEQRNSVGPIRVACVGDSITEVTNYPADLQTLLGKNYEVENFGVVGATVLLNTDRPYLNQTEFQLASNFKPNIVVIILGTNDARSNIFERSENFTEDYKQLIFGFQNLLTKPKILLALPPPIFNNTLDLVSEDLVQGIIPQIRQVAGELKLPIVDLYSSLLEYPQFFPDGVHPNNDGASLIAQNVFNAINLSN